MAERLDSPDYRRITIGLGRLARSLTQINTSWHETAREQSLSELREILAKLHEIEEGAELISDELIRGYIVDRLDTLAAWRRSIAEEIRWDMEAATRAPT